MIRLNILAPHYEHFTKNGRHLITRLLSSSRTNSSAALAQESIETNSSNKRASHLIENPAENSSMKVMESRHEIDKILGTIREALEEKALSLHQLESFLENPELAVKVRRDYISARLQNTNLERKPLDSVSPRATDELEYQFSQMTNGKVKEKNSSAILPMHGAEFDSTSFYEQILNTNCESVIGFLPIPVGAIGPLKINGEDFFVPLATTEGALLASVNRGARALAESLEGGVRSFVLRDGMTRSPALRLPSAGRASEFAEWIEAPEQHVLLDKIFSSTTRFGKFQSVRATVAGRMVFLRFKCTTGDAMGMNMVGKGVNEIVRELMGTVPDLELVSLSGNFCTDKKPSAINWVEGRGKSVVCEATLRSDVVERVLKTTVSDLVNLNISKNLIGSALAGSIGGNNAHSSNIVTAAFLALGQDPAQNVESSNCMTLLEPVTLEDGTLGLHASVTMPALEVGTVGGGTTLPAQAACLDMLGVRGAHHESPGSNARKLACIIAGTVLAGELSLNSALASNHLISAHMKLNRAPSKEKTSHSLRSDAIAKKLGKVPASISQPKHTQPIGLKQQRTSNNTDLLGPTMQGIRRMQVTHGKKSTSLILSPLPDPSLPIP